MEYHKNYYDTHKDKFVEYYNKRKVNATKCEICDKNYLNIKVHAQSKKHKNKENVTN